MIRPGRVSGLGLPGEDGRRPLVVPGTLVRVPRSRIRRAVVDEVEHRVVGEKTPHRAAADLPGLGRPALHSEIGAAVQGVEGMEPRADQHVLVGAGGVSPPDFLAVRRVQRGQFSADAELSSAVADEDFSFDDERGHRDRLPRLDVGDLRRPGFLARVGVERDRPAVERVVENLSVGIGRAAIDDVATRDTLRRGDGERLVRPLRGSARLRQVERVEDVGVGRRDVHRPADHEGRRLVAAVPAGREGEGDLQAADVPGVDLVESREAGPCIVLRGRQPLAVFGFRRRRRARLVRARGGLRRRLVRAFFPTRGERRND